MVASGNKEDEEDKALGGGGDKEDEADEVMGAGGNKEGERGAEVAKLGDLVGEYTDSCYRRTGDCARLDFPSFSCPLLQRASPEGNARGPCVSPTMPRRRGGRQLRHVPDDAEAADEVGAVAPGPWHPQ